MGETQSNVMEGNESATNDEGDEVHMYAHSASEWTSFPVFASSFLNADIMRGV